MNASFGIYFPRFIGTIYEILSAPVSFLEIVIGYVGAAATKSIILGVIILATAGFFVPLQIAHPFWMVAFLVLTAVTFSLLGFILGIWADGFEKLQVVPLLIITPLTFLGGSFYSIDVLPPSWRTVSLFNPVVYLVSGFRWSFFEIVRCRRRHQPRHDAGVSRHLPRGGVVDVPDRIQAEELSSVSCPGRAAQRETVALQNRDPSFGRRLGPGSSSAPFALRAASGTRAPTSSPSSLSSLPPLLALPVIVEPSTVPV